MLGTRTLLGLAIDEFGVVVADVAARSGRPEVRRVGQLTFEQKLSTETAKELGQQLRQFLRANHFSSKHAVVGVPTKWVVTKEISAPPASPDALGGILSIQAERAFSLNASDLVFDYFGRTSTSESSKVTLLAARRQMIDEIKDLTTAAGLQVEAVTVSALAFSKLLTGQGSEVRYGLYARSNYCEFWSQANGQLRTVKHVPMTSTNGTMPGRAEQLTDAIQRLILLSGEHSQKPPHEVTIYDAGSESEGLVDRLNAQLQPTILITDGRSNLVSDRMTVSEGSDGHQSLAAAAVAMAAAASDKPAVDFLNPRIGRKKAGSRKRVVIWSAAVALVLIAAIGGAAYDWVTKQSAIHAYQARLDGMSEEVDAVQRITDRMSYARPWTSQEPVFLDCLLELTETFPEQGTIWATNFALNETGHVSLVGKARNSQSFDSTLRDLAANTEAFEDVVPTNLNEQRSPAEFTITLTFRGAK